MATRCDENNSKEYGGRANIICTPVLKQRIIGDVLSFEGFRWPDNYYVSGFNLITEDKTYEFGDTTSTLV